MKQRGNPNLVGDEITKQTFIDAWLLWPAIGRIKHLSKTTCYISLSLSLSALDASSEAIVQETLNKVQSEKSHTTLIIGHVFSNIKRADEIVIVSEGGSIVDQGTHAEVFMQYTVQNIRDSSDFFVPSN